MAWDCLSVAPLDVLDAYSQVGVGSYSAACKIKREVIPPCDIVLYEKKGFSNCILLHFSVLWE